MRKVSSLRSFPSCLVLLVSSLLFATPAVAAIGTAFTYQGRIADNGTAITGVVDLEFELYDALAGPASVAGPVAVSDVTCSNGLFTVELDFGATPFDGQQLWLEIRVSPDYPTVSYTVLAPRQELTPTPHAIFATNASSAAAAADADLLDGIDSTGFSLVSHGHAASAITGVADGLVVYGSGGGTSLTGEAGFAYDPSLDNLAVPNDMNVGGVYRIGTNPVLRVMTALDNTFAGLAGNASVTGTANSAFGDGALVAATTGVDNTALGRNSLAAVTIESSNTAVGANSLAANARAGADPSYFATGNTAVGVNALNLNTKGFANVAVGASSLSKNTEGFFNTAVGAQALANLTTTGSGQTAVGFNALSSATTAIDNTAVGTNALASNLTGNANTAVGVNALTKATVSDNVAVGDTALGNTTTGNRNSALGTKALTANVTGADNTAMGALALQKNLSSQNTGIGASALLNNQNGASNTAVGAYALTKTTIGGNTALGANSLDDVTSGANNTAVGTGSGNSLVTGSGNVFLGYEAGSALTGAEGNNILIGSSGVAGDSSRIRIGATQTRAFMAGIRGATTGVADAIPVVIDSAGQLGTVSSSRRFKEDIRDMGASSEQLLALRPVVFLYREEVVPNGPRVEQYGLIAEEVEAVNPDWVVYGPDGKILTVRYDQVNAALLGLVQQQQTRIDDLESQLLELASRLARLEEGGSR